MSDERRSYLIAYDINDDARRAHIAKTLHSHGERIQYSVFLLRIRPARLLKLRAKVESELDMSVDSVVICDLGPTARTSHVLEFIGARQYRDLDIPTVI